VNSGRNVNQLQQYDCQFILNLRLLISRAAQKDSLSWWEDESLTEAGSYLIERLFANAPDLAARKLALKAAYARHQAAFAEVDNALHLFHLDQDGKIELALRNVSLTSMKVPFDPIDTIDKLKSALLEILQDPPKIELVGERNRSRLEIELGVDDPQETPIGRAKALAWAYLQGDMGKPVFPYIKA